jgi:hypothetical protein
MVNITLVGFETTVTLDLSGQLYTADSGELDVSCNASFEVSLDEMKNVFKYQTDAENILQANQEQIRYYVAADKWRDEIAAGNNPANAKVDEAPVDPAHNPIATGGNKQATYPDNKMYVCHDFIRFLALKLFNTHEGADLFVNQKELLLNIRERVHNASWSWSASPESAIKQALEAVDMTNPSDPQSTLLKQDGDNLYYTTSEDEDSSGNICRVIAEQLMLEAASRFQSITDSDAKQSLPFEDGDTLDFKIIIKPAAGQHELTGVDQIEGRSYKISLVMKASPAVQDIAADEEPDV